MRLLFITVYVFGLVNSRMNFPRAKHSDFFTATSSKSFEDYIVVQQNNVSSIMPIFQNPKAQGKSLSFSFLTLLCLITTDYYVNGTTIPDVEFDVGPSWAGLLPISNMTNESRQLFFWYFPSQSIEGVNDLIIWLNGGPGCSR